MDLKKKKILKITLTIIQILFFIVLFIYPTFSYAVDNPFGKESANTFSSEAKTAVEKQNSGTNEALSIIKSGIGSTFYILQLVGSGIAIGVFIFLAVKYMVSSIEDRAQIKQSMIKFVIGSVIFFSSVGIIDIMINLTQDVVDIAEKT